MNIINGKEIYEHWYNAHANIGSILGDEDAYLSYKMYPMVFELPIDTLDDVWVQFNRDEINSQKCIIETIYDGILLRKFNPFIDQYIHSYFEVDEYKKVTLVEQMKCNFDNLFDVNSFTWIKSPQFITQ